MIILEMSSIQFSVCVLSSAAITIKPGLLSGIRA